MRTRFRLLILCLLLVAGTLSSVPVFAGPRLSPPQQEGLFTPMPGVLTPADLIEVVNFLRLQHGLNLLTVHNVLMDVAASQANALAASGGAVGHQRPCGMTLGQERLLKGFPLWGDLSMDGYRSENWGTAMTADETISKWLGNDLHANTMLSPNRSDIGAAVIVSDQIYVVLETALRTNSGQHQGTAYDILIGIPMPQAACRGWATQNCDSIRHNHRTDQAFEQPDR